MRIKLTAILLLISLQSYCETNEVLSPEQTLQIIQDDTAKARLFKSIAESYITTEPEKALLYADSGLVFVKKMKWNKGIGVFFNLKGRILIDQGKYKQASDFIQKAYETHKADKDDFNTAASLNNLGNTFLGQSNYEKSMAAYIEALKISEGIPNDYLTATSLENIATVYINQNNIDKALQYQFKSLTIKKRINDPALIAASHSNIANSYILKKDTIKAGTYYQEALKEYLKNGDQFGIATIYSNLSNTIKDVGERIYYMKLAQEIWEEISPSHTTSLTNLGNLGQAYLSLLKSSQPISLKYKNSVPDSKAEILNSAEIALFRGQQLSKEVNDIANYAFITGILAEVYAEKGQFSEAYTSTKIYHEIMDSLYSQETKNKIAAIDNQQEMEVRDKEIAINKLTITAQKRKNIILIIGILLIAIIGILLLLQNRFRKKTNLALQVLNNELLESNQIKARFFAIISHDLRKPIASLIAFLNLNKENPTLLNEASKEKYHHQLTTSAEDLLENMENILLWSKEQMENFSPEITAIKVEALFEMIQKHFIQDQQIPLIFEHNESIIIQSDINYLKVIMLNLTINAQKALIHTDSPFIKWKAQKIGAKVVLSIQDNGPGISEKAANTFFTDDAITNGINGFGMYIIRDLSKAIHCDIRLTKPEEGGTIIELELKG